MKVCFCLALTLWVSDAIAAKPLFAERSVFELTLAGPFDRIDSERDKAQEYPGTVSYNSAGEAVELDLKYTVRGNFRLQKRVCQHAQLWLDLKKNKVEGTLFEGQNKLKLVVQCRDRDTHEDYLALEEQVYRMFNLLSPISLRTRLVRVTYRDSESGGERTHLGFIIQHQKRLARELDMDVLEVPNLPIHDLDPHQSSLVALFMFLIANTDYSMIAGKPDEDCCHNTKPLVDAAGRVYAVPYDFDSTGYVSANYAQVSEGLGQRSIKDRVYRGFCVDDAILAANLATLRQQQSAILAIAGDSSIVSQRKAKQAVRLLERSFDIINDERRLQREVIRACR
ncbi:MAG: hypothetical protein ABR612_03215 [Chromatocurvus sp.]